MSLIDFAGTDDEAEAIHAWTAERAAMIEIHNENKLLKKEIRALKDIITLADKALTLTHTGGALLLPHKTLEAITKAMAAINELPQNDTVL